ncbi:MAG: D-2-hydroxyacid dehydrogenase [Anaerolineae bacterium]|nr:D-2-hydroxyacid dehydrogenase [Anaerolineae bacterium]
MTTVLIASYLEPQYIEQIRQAVPEVEVIYRPDLLGKPIYQADHYTVPNRTPDQEAEWRALLAQADILFDFDFSHREDLPDLAPILKWIQATSAGIGQAVKRYGYDTRTNWVFTTASGIHARPLAEFVMMAVLMFAKDYQYLQDKQAAQQWQRYCSTELVGKTLAIIGLGKIGQETAKLAKAFDMRVIGSRRHPDRPVAHVDKLYGPDELPALLREADYLALACPHTPETENLIGAKELATLPRGAVLINIARGAVVDQNALIEALQTGHLRGAALDVFSPEPLPKGNPLWEMPNVLISPHSASTADTENQKLTTLFIDNLNRYLKGEPLINKLDTVKLY